MFNQKLINVLIKAQAILAIVVTVLVVIWGFITSGQMYYDAAGAIGYFIGLTVVTLAYTSLWYVILAALYKYNNK
jgi:hypothetical protein